MMNSKLENCKDRISHNVSLESLELNFVSTQNLESKIFDLKRTVSKKKLLSELTNSVDKRVQKAPKSKFHQKPFSKKGFGPRCPFYKIPKKLKPVDSINNKNRKLMDYHSEFPEEHFDGKNKLNLKLQIQQEKLRESNKSKSFIKVDISDVFKKSEVTRKRVKKLTVIEKEKKILFGLENSKERRRKPYYRY